MAIVLPVKAVARREGRRAKTEADYEAFRAAAGSWKDVDTDELIADIYESGKRPELEETQTAQDIWASYDPEQVQRALKTSAGALSDVDREALLSDIHKQRQQADHGHRS